MENVAKAGPNVIRAHLQYLKEHGQVDLVHNAIAFLNEHHIDIPEHEGKPFGSGCPGSMALDLRRSGHQTRQSTTLPSELGNWPIQLQLLNPDAPYLKNADLLLAADCAPFSYANFHQRFLRDRILIIFCPKLDATIDEYVDKLSDIFQRQDVKSISIVHMEVPCCSGVEIVVRRALEAAQKNIIIKDYTISIHGGIV